MQAQAETKQPPRGRLSVAGFREAEAQPDQPAREASLSQSWVVRLGEKTYCAGMRTALMAYGIAALGTGLVWLIGTMMATRSRDAARRRAAAHVLKLRNYVFVALFWPITLTFLVRQIAAAYRRQPTH